MTQIDYQYWGNLLAIEIWEAAALMGGYEPRQIALGEIVVNDDGDCPDLSDEQRTLFSAVAIGQLEGFPSQISNSPLKTQIPTASFISWLRGVSMDALADALATRPAHHSHESSNAEAEARRRLSLLRKLGGSINRTSGSGSKWKIKGISKLAHAESSEGKARSSEKTIRADLIKAAELERDANRVGAFTFP
jgi:hypothetical protein